MRAYLYLLLVPAVAASYLRPRPVFSILAHVSTIRVSTHSSPSSGHYGDPLARVCQPDEANVTIEGVSGSVCAPGCTMNSCPTDLPQGVNATPTCNIINWGTGLMYCSLGCGTNSSCGHNATCKPVQDVFLCTYDQ